jgi:hypothetical protein
MISIHQGNFIPLIPPPTEEQLNAQMNCVYTLNNALRVFVTKAPVLELNTNAMTVLYGMGYRPFKRIHGETVICGMPGISFTPEIFDLFTEIHHAIINEHEDEIFDIIINIMTELGHDYIEESAMSEDDDDDYLQPETKRRRI